MKFKMGVSTILLASLLAGCTGVRPEKTVEKNDVPPAVRPAAAGKHESAVSEAELLYVNALREQDKARRDELFKSARKALTVEAEQHKNVKAHLLLGYMADLGQGMPSDGIQAARHYRIAADSGLPEAKIALAEFWRRNEIFLDEAAKQITGIPGYEENPAALCTLGAIYYAMYENEKGFQLLKKAYTAQKRTPGTRMDVLKILHGAFERFFKGKNYDAALLELKRADELEPGNYLTPYLMGLVEFRRGNVAEAEKLFNRSLERNPAIPEPYRERAFVKARSGRFEEAVDDAKIAYAISGKRADFERALLEIYLLAKRSDDLLRMTDQLLKIQPDRKEIRLIRVTMLQLRKKYREAYDDLQILMRDPKLTEDPVILESLANTCSGLGRYAEAVRATETILKQGFRPVPALNLAELYIVSGQFDKAAALLENPGLKEQKAPLIRCIVPYLKACALLASGKNADEPVKCFHAALPDFRTARKDPGEWDVSMFRAWLKEAELPSAVKQKIAEMTDAIVAPQAAVEPAKPAAAPGREAGTKDGKTREQKPVPESVSPVPGK